MVVFDVSMNLYRLITDFSIRRFSGFLLILFFASIFHFEEINFQSFYFDFIQSLIYLLFISMQTQDRFETVWPFIAYEID